jgi:excisionase family DNA binding protein
MRNYNEYDIIDTLKRIEGKIDGLKKVEIANEYLSAKRLKPITADTLLTIEEVSEIISVSKTTIKRWMKNSKIAFVKLPGRSYRIKKANLDNWIQMRSVKESYRYY